MSSTATGRSTLFLVRHGVVHNPGGMVYGHLPRFRLSAEGREQAIRAGAWLARHGIGAIVSSPLLRARQTARTIQGAAGHVPLRLDRRLRETDLARLWEGLTWTEVERDHAALYRLFLESPSRVTVGETMTAMAARMEAACRAAARRFPGTPLALISHRDPILALRLALCNADPDGLHRTPCRQGSITVLSSVGTALRVEDYIEP